MNDVSVVDSRGVPIPRIVHRLWLGSNPIPQLFVDYEDSWRRLHPSWEMRLWRDEDLTEIALPADLPSGFKRRYDIIRLEILRRCGGVIIDLDVEAVRPLDPILSGVDAFVGRIGRHHIGNQVLGAIPHHPFFVKAADRLRTTIRNAESSSDMAGKGFLRQMLTEYPEGVTVFPAETFYYEPSIEPPRRPDDFPAVFAVHHSVGSYVTAPDEAELQHRLDRLHRCIEEVAALLMGFEGNADTRARLSRVAERLKKMEAKARAAAWSNDRAHRARFKRLEADLEQEKRRRHQT